MDAQRIGGLIREMRKAQGLTQAELAERLHVSDKAVSKWERGAGCPDAATLPEAARVLGISVTALMAGDTNDRDNDGGNMKRLKVYQCPQCGNLLTATGEPEVSCCGRPLTPLTPQAADALHCVTLTPVEDEWLAEWTHPMEKAHHLSFLLEIGFDRIALVRLYPEGGCDTRLPRLPGGKFFVGCSEEGMFRVK